MFDLIHFFSVVVCAEIVVPARPVPVCRHAGTPTTPSVIPAISSGTRDSPVRSVTGRTGRMPTGRWCSALFVASKLFLKKCRGGE